MVKAINAFINIIWSQGFFGIGINIKPKLSRNSAAKGRDLPGVKSWKAVLVKWEK
jgi:hypothetical protein